MKKLIILPYSFALMNWAAVAALYYFLRGRKDVWVRRDAGSFAGGNGR